MEEQEIIFTGGQDFVAPGIYEAICLSAEGPKPYNVTRKVYLTFEIVSEREQGKQVPMYFNIPWSGIGLGSKYYKYWSYVNCGQPSRNTKMSPRIFTQNQNDRRYMITVETVERRFEDGSPMGIEYLYSKVKHFIVME